MRRTTARSGGPWRRSSPARCQSPGPGRLHRSTAGRRPAAGGWLRGRARAGWRARHGAGAASGPRHPAEDRSEEHTSELQSTCNIGYRLLLVKIEKKLISLLLLQLCLLLNTAAQVDTIIDRYREYLLR